MLGTILTSHLLSSLLLFVTSPLAIHAKVYVFKGDPYHGGDLPVRYTNLASYKELPLYTLLFYPLEPGEYAPIVFVPGLEGIVPPDLYTDTLEHLASHGYVVVAMDTVIPLAANGKLHNDEILTKRVYEEVIWLKSNLAQQVLPSLVDNVTVDWSLLGLAAHSAGGDTILQLLQNRTLGAKAAAFMEPFSVNFREPLGYSIPALSFGTELCEKEPNCCIPGIDYRHFYDMLECPRVLMNVTDYGHCAILNDYGWKTCRDTHFCATNPSVDRDIYREYVAGAMSALFGTYLQGNRFQSNYLIAADLIPFKMGAYFVDVYCQ